jgi:hypothetical protein
MKPTPPIRPLAVLLKGLALFIVLDLLLAACPLSGLGRLSLYNGLFPGRQRFPFGENPAESYNLSLFDLDAMFASHGLTEGPKPVDEYRVFLVGDSSVWGTLLRPEETLAGQLDADGLSACGRTVRVYNLGYPTISLTKDLMVLDYAMRYDPDLVVWLTTLEAFPLDKQLTSPIVVNNAARIDDLIERYDLPLDPSDPALVRPDFWDRTLIGQRRPIADLLRLQMYGVMWAATGVDQAYPDEYEPAAVDLEADLSFHGLDVSTMDWNTLNFRVLDAGYAAVGDMPLLLVNEPMLISGGANSDLRYNFFYPRWAYDRYRMLLSDYTTRNERALLDLWDLIPDASYYTNSAIHLTHDGEAILAARLAEAILQQECP